MMKRRGYGAWICLVGLAPFLAAIPAGLSQAGEAGVRIENAWARATPEGSTVGAAYANIQAAGAADTLVSASSPVAGRVEIHTHLVEDGVMKMRRLEKLAIGAGETAKLKPSGDHIMLFDLKQALKEGAKVPLTLVFEKAGEIQVEAGIEPVGSQGPGAAPAAAGHEGHQMDHSKMDHSKH
jgi:periplasmic copper chaperone A